MPYLITIVYLSRLRVLRFTKTLYPVYNECQIYLKGGPKQVRHITSLYVMSHHVTSLHVNTRHYTSRHVTSRQFIPSYHLKSRQISMKEQFDRSSHVVHYNVGNFVYVWRPAPAGCDHRKFYDHFRGPFKICSFQGHRVHL